MARNKYWERGRPARISAVPTLLAGQEMRAGRPRSQYLLLAISGGQLHLIAKQIQQQQSADAAAVARPAS